MKAVPPPQQTSRDPAGTTDAAVTAVDRAEAELARALESGAWERPPPAPVGLDAPVDPSSRPPAPAKLAAPPPEPAPPAAAPPRDLAGAPLLARGGPCAVACAALASMERATSHLCGLTGASDARCQNAEARLKNATTRVHAVCPACR